MQSTVFRVKDYKTLKTGGNVLFLNHWLQNSGSCRKHKFFPENIIFKGIIFLYFQTATCYITAAYNIACPQLNGDTLISLYAVLLMLERVWTLLPRFSADVKVTHEQDISSVIAANKLKSKVLKNNTMNGKNLRIIWWVLMNGKRG